ncbi:protein RCC2-like [Tubulanus polymorphus]|uniref:protein RCC2-like n=1 Tax=Tubulanus polymorphus TaxID=672921 RepID=UPI003DA30E36
MPRVKRKVDDVDNGPTKKGKANKNGDKEADQNSGDCILIQDVPPELLINSEAQPEVVAKKVVNFAPTNHGQVLFTGGTNWDLIGRKVTAKTSLKVGGGPNLLGPHRLSTIEDLEVHTVISGCVACHSVAITNNGAAYTWGRNEKGQVGNGTIKRVDEPTLLSSMESVKFVSAACGRNHTLLLTDTGEVYAMGDNKNGQLGIGSNSVETVLTPKKIDYSGHPIAKVACGAEFSMILDVKGNLYSFGLPEYGQLGHNTNGEYFVTASRMGFASELRPRRVVIFIEKSRDGHVTPVKDVTITDVACGANHTIAIDAKKRLYSWGFGGYGRLGHSSPKDEMVPRLLSFFDRAKMGAVKIAAGTAFNLCLNELGCLYQWGQTKSAGEAIMYPKPVNDLAGWMVKKFSCGSRSMIVHADDSIISWAPSPTYGELGYGEHKPKSSTMPLEAKPLTGLKILDIAAGFGHTLFVVSKETDEDKELLEKLPVFKST